MSVAHAEKGVNLAEAAAPESLGQLALAPEVQIHPVAIEAVKNLHIGPIDLINCQLTSEQRIAVELLGGRLSDVDALHPGSDQLPLQ